jgi:AcrR family transcriptional regulator
MAGATRLTEQGRERKQQLLDTASELFASRGYESTRIADICAAAGVAKGLFYWYFDTKESLFAELVRSMRLALRRAQGAAMDPETDPVARIRAGSEATIRFMAEHRAYYALLDHGRVGAHDEVVAGALSEGAEVYASDVERLVREGQALGLIPDADPRVIAAGVVGTVSSFGHALRSGRLTQQPDELATFVGEWVERAVAGSRPG